jgi:flagellar motor switch/type III secretory pathway protein FliN
MTRSSKSMPIKSRLKQIKFGDVARQGLIDRLRASEPLSSSLTVGRSPGATGSEASDSLAKLVWGWSPPDATTVTNETGTPCIVFTLANGQIWFELRVSTPAALDELELRCIRSISFSDVGPELEDVDELAASKLPAALYAQVRTAQIQPLLRLLERYFSTELVVSSVRSEVVVSVGRSAIPFVVNVDAPGTTRSSICGTFTPMNRLSWAKLDVVAAALRPSPARRDWAASWPLSLTWYFGTVDMSVSDFTTLARGDVILLDRDAVGWRVFLGGGAHPADEPKSIGYGHLAITDANQTSFSLDDTAVFYRTNAVIWSGAFHGDSSMSDLTQAESLVSPTLATDGLSVQLRFSLPAQNLPFSRLGSLAVGSVLTFEHLVESSCVTVSCGKSTLGTGQIVAVGDCLGVQLTFISQHLDRQLSDASLPASIETASDEAAALLSNSNVDPLSLRSDSTPPLSPEVISEFATS